MVTPSLVIVGAPHFLSRTTLRPRGPRVTLTVSASLLMPASSALRASSLNESCLAMLLLLGHRMKPRPLRPGLHARVLLDDDGEDVAGGEHQVLVAADLDLGSAVLRVDDDVALGDVDGNAVAVVVNAARAHGHDLALLGLLLGGVRDDQAGSRGLLGLERLNNDAILERLDGDRHADLSFAWVTNGYGAVGVYQPSSRCQLASTSGY